MDRPEIEISRREEFSASHRLHNPDLSDEENRELFGICNNPHGHGHNYELLVTVRGPVPEETGMVLDLNRLQVLIQELLIREVDHKHLNHDVAFLDGVIPTAENLVLSFWRRLEPALEDFEGCRLHRMRLYESRNNFVELEGPI